MKTTIICAMVLLSMSPVLRAGERELYAATYTNEHGVVGPASILVPAGYATIADYLKLQPFDRQMYIRGIIDGIRLAPLYANRRDAGAVVRVMDNLTIGQIVAMVDEWIRLHPDKRYKGVNTAVYNAIEEYADSK